MAIVELKVPSPGESITEVVIARWVRNTGDIVEKDEVLAEVDSDKATLTLNAEESGKIEVLAAEGDTVKVGQVELSFTHRKPFEFKSKKGREIKVKVRVLKDFGDNDELSRHLNKGRKGGKKGKGGKGRKGWRFNKKPHKFHHKYNKYKSRHHRIEW